MTITITVALAAGCAPSPKTPRADQTITNYGEYKAARHDLVEYLLSVSKEYAGDCPKLDKIGETMLVQMSKFETYEQAHPGESERYLQENDNEMTTLLPALGELEKCKDLAAEAAKGPKVANLADYTKRSHALRAKFETALKSMKLPADCKRFDEVWNAQFSTEQNRLTEFWSDNRLYTRPASAEEKRDALAQNYWNTMCTDDRAAERTAVMAKLASIATADVGNCTKFEKDLIGIVDDMPRWHLTIAGARALNEGSLAFGGTPDPLLVQQLATFDKVNATCKIVKGTVADDNDFATRASALIARVSTTVAASNRDCRKLLDGLAPVELGPEIDELDVYVNHVEYGELRTKTRVSELSTQLHGSIDTSRKTCHD
jgi:hypothetical protein